MSENLHILTVVHWPKEDGPGEQIDVVVTHLAEMAQLQLGACIELLLPGELAIHRRRYFFLGYKPVPAVLLEMGICCGEVSRGEFLSSQNVLPPRSPVPVGRYSFENQYQAVLDVFEQLLQDLRKMKSPAV